MSATKTEISLQTAPGAPAPEGNLGWLLSVTSHALATEMLAMVADEALQIHGGLGVMSDLPLERIWRDARIERIWEGTSEVQRHIISRALLRPLGG